MKLTLVSCGLVWLATAVGMVDAYDITAAGDISLTDVETGISDLRTVFTDEDTLVTVSGLEWEDTETVTEVTFETFVNGKLKASGTVDTTEGLPDSIDAGTVVVKDRGTASFYVKITSGETSADTQADFQSFGNGVAIIPLLVVLGLAVTTQMVRSVQIFQLTRGFSPRRRSFPHNNFYCTCIICAGGVFSHFGHFCGRLHD